MEETTIRIASLHVYPVKGCRGVSPPAALAAPTGLAVDGAGDREWMVVDATGRFVTQRELPRLALVDATVAVTSLRLDGPGAAALEIPMARARAGSRDVVVWRSDVGGHDEGDSAAAWFRAILDADVRLVRFDRTRTRLCNPEFAADSGAHTLFADGYPVLVTGQASLAELNARLAARASPPIPMDRFRPNIVLDGLAPFALDHVDTIEVDGVVLKCVKPCVRCQVTTTDQVNAQRGDEPLRTLGEFRMDARCGGVTFGMNAIVVAGAGRTLTRGASARVEYRF